MLRAFEASQLSAALAGSDDEPDIKGRPSVCPREHLPAIELAISSKEIDIFRLPSKIQQTQTQALPVGTSSQFVRVVASLCSFIDYDCFVSISRITTSIVNERQARLNQMHVFRSSLGPPVQRRSCTRPSTHVVFSNRKHVSRARSAVVTAAQAGAQTVQLAQEHAQQIIELCKRHDLEVGTVLRTVLVQHKVPHSASP